LGKSDDSEGIILVFLLRVDAAGEFALRIFESDVESAVSVVKVVGSACPGHLLAFVRQFATNFATASGGSTTPVLQGSLHFKHS
jgi:hypothetical protein